VVHLFILFYRNIKRNPDPTNLSFSQPVMRLVIDNAVQAVMDVLCRRFHLKKSLRKEISNLAN
jgi:c-di-GMP-related signal transduction protein